MLMKKRLPNKEFQQMVPLLRQKGFYENNEEPRKIVWSEYNLSQIEDAKDTLIFIRTSVDKSEYMNTNG